MKRIFGLLTAFAFVLGLLTIGPVTGLAPKDNQPVASAAAVGSVYNWRYSNARFKVYQKANGKGNYQGIYPGKSSSFGKVGFPDSFYVGPGCHASLDTHWDARRNYYTSWGSGGAVFNFPKNYKGNRVIVEYYCPTRSK